MMPNETTNTPILTLDSDAKLETARNFFVKYLDAHHYTPDSSK